MSFLERVLEPPAYGWSMPTRRQIFAEFFSRLNILTTKKNWLALLSWSATMLLTVPFFVFVFKYFSWTYALIGLFYSMVILGSHGTFWLHRHGTHRAFKFRNPWIKMFCRNLVIKVIPEEIYIVSHHVHHLLSEKPGDPYNVHGGWLYCFLADVNHQGLARKLSAADYKKACALMNQTGVILNTYSQYQRWGSLCHPAFTLIHYLLNWGFWYFAFFMLGGHALATAIFGMSAIWAFGVRTFNFDGHGRGKDKRQVGIDFNREDFSVNQVWPGYVAGEWHNNHHLYPHGARSGFLPYQIDIPWYWIKSLHFLRGISSYRDFKVDFFRDHYDPHLAKLAAKEQSYSASLHIST